MSLRARLLAVLVSLTAIGLVVAGIATYASLRSFLVDRVDRTATGAAEAISRTVERPRPGGLGSLDAIGEANPGIYVGAVDTTGTGPLGRDRRRGPGDTPLPQPNLSAAAGPGRRGRR